MTTVHLRSLGLIEALAFSAYVAWYIWQLQASTWSSWLVFPVWMLASFVVHRDTPKTMGWRADNLWSSTKRSAVVFVPNLAGLFLAGNLPGPWHRPCHHVLRPPHFFVGRL